ncbi:MAG: hypothetical protein RL632_153 [Bacteroidota bacterium]|jgi:hypothetical protein
MNTTPEHNERIAKITLATLYPLYVAKVERKGRTKDELLQVIEWLTGFNAQKLEELISEDVDMSTFFSEATIHPNADMVTGMICGYRIEELLNPLTKNIRIMDKLVDELAKGKKMEVILRAAKVE